MKKKCLTLAVLLFLLMGCNNNAHSGNNNDTDVGNHFVKENTTIEFLCLTDDGYRDELERMIKEFKEIEPKVTVNLVNPIAAGHYSVLEKTVISGFFKDDYPDLAQCYPDNVVQYLDRGYAVNLEPYLNHEEYGLKDERNDYRHGKRHGKAKG